MNRTGRSFHLVALLNTACLSSVLFAQELVGLRVNGPNELVEGTQAAYTVYALFDNGIERDVTLYSTLSLNPGLHATIDQFGVLRTGGVDEDSTEQLEASFTWGDQTRSASQNITILDVGTAGYALLFDGNLDRAQVEYDLLNSLPLTLEAWVRLDALQADHMTVISNNRPNFWGHGIQIDRNGRLGVMGHDFQEYSDATLTVGVWCHVCVVFEWGRYRLYLNAKEVKTRSYTQLTPDGQKFFWIGKNTADNTNTKEREFPGMIDEVRVWQVARSPEAILCAMRKRLDGTEPGLVGYYRFDEGAGQYVRDASPFGHDGVLGRNDTIENDADPDWAWSEADIHDHPDVDTFTVPRLISEISTGNEWGVSLAPDGRSAYISSERDGTNASDIYYTERRSFELPFSTPIVIREISIAGYQKHEFNPFISNDERRIYFARGGNPFVGDLYVAERLSKHDPWEQPVAIDSLNTSANEYGMTVTADELDAVLMSARSGPLQYWEAHRTHRDGNWQDVSVIAALTGYEARGCHISPDGLTLYITAREPGGQNGFEPWVAQRVSRDEAFGVPEKLDVLASSKSEFSISVTGDDKRLLIVRQRNNAGDVYESVRVTNEDCSISECDAIVSLRARCRAEKLVAKLRTLLPPGVDVTLDNEGKRMTVATDSRGRCKAVFHEQFGIHTVYVVGCENIVYAVNCGE